MKTPICDFVNAYAASDPLRFHMPGHKGRTFLGPEKFDITEIEGADVLYGAKGVIRKSEENAAALFGSGATFYSTEGSSLSVRAGLLLTKLFSGKKRPHITASRNAHRSFLSAAALLDIDVDFVGPGVSLSEDSLTGGIPDGTADAGALVFAAADHEADAVYVTSPDYLGRISDIASIAKGSRKLHIPLLVDNAHGAYLKFMEESMHPIDMGADLVFDSAHKTLPVLTGGAYFHVAGSAPEFFMSEAERSLRVFASTSPSYLILSSLDMANRMLSEDLPQKIRLSASRLRVLKTRLSDHGYRLIGDEPLKLSIDAFSYGYTGEELAGILRGKGIYAEMGSLGAFVLMCSSETEESDFERLEEALLSIPAKEPKKTVFPEKIVPEKAASLSEAMFGKKELLPVEKAAGRVLAEVSDICPPCVPVVLPGERLSRAAAEMLKFLGAKEVFVLK